MKIPKYQRLSGDIRSRIANGELTPGEQLPTAVELAQQFDVSIGTVTQALKALKAEGLLRSDPAVGTFVLPPRRRLRWSLSDFEQQRGDSFSADAWKLLLEQQGMKSTTEVQVRRINPSAEVASWLEVSLDDTVIVRDRIRYANDSPYVVSRSYFPKWVAAGTRLEEPGDQSAPGGLLLEAGHPQVRVRDSIEVSIASAQDAGQISLPPGSPIWKLLRIGFDADGRPVRAMETIAPADLLSVEFDQTLRTGEVSSPFRCAEFPPDPYPGARPDSSFVEYNEAAWVLKGDLTTHGAWSVDIGGAGSQDLDDWLGGFRASRLDGRLPLLAYGSNACPGKFGWLRSIGLQGPSVVVKADVTGAAAVWSAGLRVRDDQRPAVLAKVEGVVERHAVWFVTPDQRLIFDGVEGRGQRYRLAWVHVPVTLENGERLDWVLAYVGRPFVEGDDRDPRTNRAPLLVDGHVVRVEECGQAEARRLHGRSASGDGLEVVEVVGEPDWADLDGVT